VRHNKTLKKEKDIVLVLPKTREKKGEGGKSGGPRDAKSKRREGNLSDSTTKEQ